MKKDLELKKWPNYLAFVISMILSPYVTAALFFAVTVYKYADNIKQFFPWMLTFFVSAILIPGAYVLWLMESNKITDIHIANRRERKIPFLIGGISGVVGTAILIALDAAKPMVVISVVYAANALAIALITQFWKISVHMAMFSTIATICVILFGLEFWWLYLLLIPLAWARIYRKRHTIWQTTAGSIMAFILTSVTFWAFGYL